MSLEQLEKELQYLKAGEARVKKAKNLVGEAIIKNFSQVESIRPLSISERQEVEKYLNKKYNIHNPSGYGEKGKTNATVIDDTESSSHKRSPEWLLPFSLSIIFFSLFWLIVAGTVYLAHNPIVITQVVEHNTTHEITTPTIIKETNNITQQVTKTIIQPVNLTEIGSMICIGDYSHLNCTRRD